MEHYILYHHWLSPVSRRVRLHLAERDIEFSLQLEFPWARREEFLRLNPAGDVPVLQSVGTEGGASGGGSEPGLAETRLAESGASGFMGGESLVVVGGYAISEHLERAYAGYGDASGSGEKLSLLGASAQESCEIRRLVSWFDEKFHAEVYQYIVYERVIKTLSQRGAPDSSVLSAGYRNLETHLRYCEWLLGRRDRLAGERLSLADFSAAGYLSCMDYLGCIAWNSYPCLREWYMRLKSRPSFRGLLEDVVPVFSPSPHYSNLDF